MKLWMANFNASNKVVYQWVIWTYIEVLLISLTYTVVKRINWINPIDIWCELRENPIHKITAIDQSMKEVNRL